MISLRKSSERGFDDHGWGHSHFSFSFADYHDPDHMGFGVLRALMEDTIAAGGGPDTLGGAGGQAAPAAADEEQRQRAEARHDEVDVAGARVPGGLVRARRSATSAAAWRYSRRLSRYRR